MISFILAAIVAQTPVRTEPNPLQYMQSCMPGPLYSIQFSAANRAKVLVSPGGDGRVRLDFGTQWKVSCDANGIVLACLHQTLNATISLGLGSDGGDGEGWTTADFPTTPVGAARCVPLTAQTPTDFFKVSKASFACTQPASSRSPLTRCGYCGSLVSGAFHQNDPCRVDADCGGTVGSCITGTNQGSGGVFISFVPVSASSVCHLSRCDQ